MAAMVSLFPSLESLHLLISGGTALAVGIGMIALPAGVIAAGVELIFAGVLVAAGDAYAKAEKDGDVSG